MIWLRFFLLVFLPIIGFTCIVQAKTTEPIEKTDLFLPGDNRVHLYRIPGLTITTGAQF